MKTENPQLASIFTDCSRKAKSDTNACMFPGCGKEAINSHIMQKNGILSSISKDRHLWESSVDHFKHEYIKFRRRGINEIYTFKGFCNEHDTSIFSKIEMGVKINFSDYQSCLLFALRTAYNEIWLKEVVIKEQKCILNHPEIFDNTGQIKEAIRQNEIGILDLEFYTKAIWEDLSNKTESFIFKFREMEFQEICLNSIYTFETSQEIMDYYYRYGKEMDRTSELFISFFPYENKSILLIGNHKDDCGKVKNFVDLFFVENTLATNVRLSSLIAFNCETWVCSDKFYKDKLEGLDSEFFKAMIFSGKNGNERKTFDINFFASEFKTKFKDFIRRNVS